MFFIRGTDPWKFMKHSGQVLFSQFSTRVVPQPWEASYVSHAPETVSPKPFRVTIGSPPLLPRPSGKQTHSGTQFLACVAKFSARWKFSVGQYPLVLPLRSLDARPSPEINMESSGASTIPIRETIDGEVLPAVAVDQAVVAAKYTWDLDSAINASTQAPGVFKMPIPTDIDPKGDYTVRTDFRPAQTPPTATPTIPVDVPEPVAMLIVLGDMKIHHERSLEEPPAHFLEGEDVDEAESDEDQAGGSTPEPLRKRGRMVTEGNLATLGLADKGFTFGSVLESHVPLGPAKQ